MKDRAKGCFFGCIVGDAFGSPCEFKDRGTFKKVTDMQDGTWTDDTSMMLCLGESLVESGGCPNTTLELEKYVAWFTEGYLGVGGECIDIGMTTKRELLKFMESGEPSNIKAGEFDQGNGSLMRVAPVPIIWAGKPHDAYKVGYRSSLSTHRHKNCATVCGIFCYILSQVVSGDVVIKGDITALLGEFYDKYRQKHGDRGDARLLEILSCKFMGKTVEQISTSGYIMDTFEAALWGFFHTDNFKDGVILLANLGDDADTVCAVYGTLAGAFYGYREIPSGWLNKLRGKSTLEDIWRKIDNFDKCL
jgi:ADP-ribosyl-[dinitrogen reductase] hydrolase